MEIYFIYILGVMFPWLFLFVNKSFTKKYYDNSFLRLWSIIYIIWAILVFLGGQADRLGFTFLSGNYFGGVGFFVGTIMGVVFFSLVTTYLFYLSKIFLTKVKILLLKVHHLTNKKP